MQEFHAGHVFYSARLFLNERKCRYLNSQSEICAMNSSDCMAGYMSAGLHSFIEDCLNLAVGREIRYWSCSVQQEAVRCSAIRVWAATASGPTFQWSVRTGVRTRPAPIRRP